MTSITLEVTGAKAKATVNGLLTSGMTGIPVTIKYDNSWKGLIKNLVCKSEPEFCSIVNTTRTITNVETTATVAHEVMKANWILYLGIEGHSSDGELIIPTTWAKCGEIHSGTNALADPSANPTLPIWAQLQTELKEIKERALTEVQISALNNMFKVCAFTNADVSEEYNAFCAAFGITDSGEDSGGDSGGSGEDSGSGNSGETEVTLTSISAAYSGGAVPVGTAMSGLTSLVVTAHYSDGSQQNVTGYTLSGTIAEGSNTITVTYQGKTATFAVTGVAVPEKNWTSGTPYDFTDKIIENATLNVNTGVEEVSEGASCTDYINCFDVDYLAFSINGGRYWFYDVSKNFISTVATASNIHHCAVPDGAVFFRTISMGITAIPVSKSADNYTAGEQLVTWSSGDYNTDGEIVSSSKRISTVFPIAGAKKLTLGDSAQATQIVLFDEHQNYIRHYSSINTPLDLTNINYVPYSFAAVGGWSAATITLE